VPLSLTPLSHTLTSLSLSLFLSYSPACIQGRGPRTGRAGGRAPTARRSRPWRPGGRDLDGQEDAPSTTDQWRPSSHVVLLCDSRHRGAAWVWQTGGAPSPPRCPPQWWTGRSFCTGQGAGVGVRRLIHPTRR
jgi:hypothetical protein